VPAPDSIDVNGLDVSPVVLTELLTVDRERWRLELPQLEAHYHSLGERVPSQLRDQLAALEKRLVE
jgi:phosphoenolpyruvate carboxykinase (GTP)